MDKATKRTSKAKRPTTKPAKASSGQAGAAVEERFPKGAMREPAQMPSHDSDELKEVKDALQDLEEQKGDWSKGG
jgi:hypothetical protein